MSRTNLDLKAIRDEMRCVFDYDLRGAVALEYFEPLLTLCERLTAPVTDEEVGVVYAMACNCTGLEDGHICCYPNDAIFDRTYLQAFLDRRKGIT